MMSVVREVPGDTGMSTMLRAALPLIPGASRVPGLGVGAKSGGELPDLTLTRTGVLIDAEHVAAYAEVCGFWSRQHLPLTYPHMLAFGLQMGIMTDPSFPYPAIGTVHLANTITQHRRLTTDDVVNLSTRPANLRPHAKGTVFDLVTTITADDQTVWESTSEYLRIGAGNESAPAADPLDVVAAGPVRWRLPADLGRRYAAVSGDHNPIHLYPLTAKAFGFRRQIAHGMWTKARCIAALDNRIPEAATVRVEFKKPVFLPSTVALGTRIDASTIDFALTRPKDGAPHLAGRVTPA